MIEGYDTFSGTSMATPHVSGAAALLWAKNPGLSHMEVKEAIMSKVDPLPSLADKCVTGGRLNVYNIVCDPNNPQLIPSLEDGFTVEQGVPEVITARLSACELLKGAIVTADFSNGDPQLAFLDDGVDPDVTADDGIYTARWIPNGLGSVTVTFDATYGDNNYSAVVDGTVVEFFGCYYDDEFPFNWIDISATGTPLNLSDDDYAYFLIPFNVTFYDQAYDHISVGSNGHVYFEDNYLLGYSNKPIPSDTGGVNNFIAALWDDLNPSAGGQIYWEVQGEASNRKLIIQFDDILRYLSNGDASFEVIFYENSSDILIQYLDVVFDNPNYDYGASATVGVQRDSNFGQQYSYNEPALSNEMAILWYQCGEPVPGIKANGSDGPVTIGISDILSVTVGLDAGNNDGEDADWWVVADTPFGWYHYADFWIPGFSVTYQGPLFDLTPPFKVLNISGLPIGSYTFCFGVDMIMNGLLDYDQLYYDCVEVNITP